MKIFIALVLGILIGALVIMFYRDNPQRAQSEKFSDTIKDGAQSAGDAIADQWHKLSTSDITNELASTGRVIREKAHAAGQAIADATADARITAAIKAKLAADSGFASLSISVNTTEGVVTLAGSVPSAEHISNAISIAMEVDGVIKVISTLQIKAG